MLNELDSTNPELTELRQEANRLYEKLQKDIANAHQSLDMPSRYFPNGTAGRILALEKAITSIGEYDRVRQQLSNWFDKQLGEVAEPIP